MNEVNELKYYLAKSRFHADTYRQALDWIIREMPNSKAAEKAKEAISDATTKWWGQKDHFDIGPPQPNVGTIKAEDLVDLD